MALLCLGSDCLIKVRQKRTGSVQAELTARHGDVVGFEGATDRDFDVTFVHQGYSFREHLVYCSLDPLTFAVCVARRFDEQRRPEKDLNTDKATQDPVGVTETPMVPTTTAPQNSLRDWYIGPVPLDTSLPLRYQPALRSFDGDGLDQTGGITTVDVPLISPNLHNGIQLLVATPGPPILLVPPPNTPRPRVIDLDPDVPTPTPKNKTSRQNIAARTH